MALIGKIREKSTLLLIVIGVGMLLFIAPYDQIISLFYLFPILNNGGYFIVEELDFPETREDMRVNHHAPDLKSILLSILKKKDFNSPYIDENTKKYFLENIKSIKIFKGNVNEIAIIKKK